MKHGTHLPQNDAHKLDSEFVKGQLLHEARRGFPWVPLDSLTKALGNKRHFTTTDLHLILKDMIYEGTIVCEKKLSGHGILQKRIDHYALK